VGVDEHLGRNIDLNLTFVAENGYPVPLSQYFKQGRPVILNLIYYSCPMLCNLILNGQTATLREIPWTPGNEFEVVTISIDPRESFDLARKKKAIYMASYERPAPGWHFLTDHQGNAKRLAELIGFPLSLRRALEQYAHSAAIFVLTPDGRISRYLYGARYRARDLRFALAEASEGRTTMTVEKMLLFCYKYDPGYWILCTVRAEHYAGRRNSHGSADLIVFVADVSQRAQARARGRGPVGPPHNPTQEGFI
jgi:protein SCO1/2